jgi:hypothetical protein
METKYVVEVREPPQEDHGEVVERLARAFGVDVRKAEGLLRRAPGAVTKPISQQKAQAVAKLFARAGIAAEARPLAGAAQDAVTVGEPAPAASEVAAEAEDGVSVPQTLVESAETPTPAEPSRPLEESTAPSAPVEAEAPTEAPPSVGDTIPPAETPEEAAAWTTGDEAFPLEEAERDETYPPRASQGPRLLLGGIIALVIIVIVILWLR